MRSASASSSGVNAAFSSSPSRYRSTRRMFSSFISLSDERALRQRRLLGRLRHITTRTTQWHEVRCLNSVAGRKDLYPVSCKFINHCKIRSLPKKYLRHVVIQIGKLIVEMASMVNKQAFKRFQGFNVYLFCFFIGSIKIISGFSFSKGFGRRTAPYQQE